MFNQICPHCGVNIECEPKAHRKCPVCENKIYVVYDVETGSNRRFEAEQLYLIFKIEKEVFNKVKLAGIHIEKVREFIAIMPEDSIYDISENILLTEATKHSSDFAFLERVFSLLSSNAHYEGINGNHYRKLSHIYKIRNSKLELSKIGVKAFVRYSTRVDTGCEQCCELDNFIHEAKEELLKIDYSRCNRNSCLISLQAMSESYYLRKYVNHDEIKPEEAPLTLLERLRHKFRPR